MTVIRMMVMEYKSIRQTLAMSSSTAKPKDSASDNKRCEWFFGRKREY